MKPVIGITAHIMSDLSSLSHEPFGHSHIGNTYVIDLNKYAPCFDAEFTRKYMLRGHMTAVGYRLMAVMINSYIDYIVRNDPEAFRDVGLSGYEYIL